LCSAKRQVGKVTGVAALLVALVIAGGAWLSNAAGHGGVWRPHGSPVVDHPAKANPPAHVSPHRPKIAER